MNLRKKMNLKPDKIFGPSTGINLMIESTSQLPMVFSSIIYDANLENQTLIIARPQPFLGKNTKFKGMYATTLVKKDNAIQRVGLKCIPIGVSKKYKLAQGAETYAIKLKFSLPIKNMDLRSGYRLSLNSQFTTKAIIIDNKEKFNSPQNFTIKDISINGMGIIIPKVLNNKVSLLTKKKLYHRAKIEIDLIKKDKGSSPKIQKVTTSFEIKRINTNYNQNYVFMGLHFFKINYHSEDIINHFILDAQIKQLNKFPSSSLTSHTGISRP